MAKLNVIFSRPVRIEKNLYPASKRSVEIDEKHMESKLMKSLIESGEASIVSAPKEDKVEAPAKLTKQKSS